jgi:hypothetical protein
MIENYRQYAPGHWVQNKISGEIIKYDHEYIQYYERMDDSMSHLRYNLLSNFVLFDSICDFGYGDGAFLKCCLKFGHKCYGHDISDYPLPNNIDFVKNLSDLDVDVISFFDSLEHIPDFDLVPFLKSIKTKNIIVSVPWMHEHKGAEWFKRWKHRKENEHFHHFDSYGLIQLLHDSGFKTVHVGNEEDSIRKSVSYLPNILTVIGKKYDQQ